MQQMLFAKQLPHFLTKLEFVLTDYEKS